jgi:hypothetical protein
MADATGPASACRACGELITRRFCSNCGRDSQCSTCGATLRGLYCGDCGAEADPQRATPKSTSNGVISNDERHRPKWVLPAAIAATVVVLVAGFGLAASLTAGSEDSEFVAVDVTVDMATTVPETTSTAVTIATTTTQPKPAGCTQSAVTAVLTNGQWRNIGSVQAANLEVDLSATKFNSSNTWAQVWTKNRPTSPGYQTAIAWFNCQSGQWVYVSYGEPPGPSCSTASEEFKAAMAEVNGDTCFPD